MSDKSKLELKIARQDIAMLRKALKPFSDAHKQMELQPNIERHSFHRHQLVEARYAYEQTSDETD